MEFWIWLLELLDRKMETPTSYGWFHLLFFALSVAAGVFLCLRMKNATEKQVRTVLILTSVLVILLELYKQINYTFTTDGVTITADYQWYIFPWQFCSVPMYVGLLAGVLKQGIAHRALCAFLATYSVFAGICVMFYPTDVFIDTIGINLQTMICHGLMISVGIFLFGSGYVKAEHKTILKAIPVFCGAVTVAMILNEAAHRLGITEAEDFNMFFISPYEDPSLPVYSLVQNVVPYPFCLIIYVTIFSIAAYIILLGAMGIKALLKKKKA